jgi:pyridinium-3,5-bisthiocarboxylic acid mononucleotide nickel chelatase
MKTAYFDLIAGASGDMILGCLIDAGLDADWLRNELTKLPISGWELQTQRVDKNGFTAIKVDVVVGPQPHARPLPEIERVIRDSTLSDSVKKRSLEVVRIIATEEARIHGMPIEEVHLHEVSGEDAIIDICGSIAAIEHLGIERVECSPFPLGRGFISGAHGQIPLPAPAAVGILKGLPIVGSPIQAELVTPTGAALLKHLASRFGPLPAMLLDSVGYGAGTWNLVIPNLLRVFIGQADAQAFDTDVVSVLETNIDDQNPEHYEHLMERMFDAGALDVTMTPTQMKKNRPGVMLSVIAKPQDKEAMRSLILTETSSLGVREQELQRSLLNRDRVEVDTPFGKTFVKIAHLPGGAHKYAPEFEDCRRLARAANVPLREVYVAAETAARYVHEHAHGHSHKH